ncbi:camk family protein kinase [Vairimorpha apis BRL 01]|uniref:Camk family protein kinase n=1 Tax=Vairimorpha apis BRL 01 TaxID=1037528 RepID=T0LCT9_9MICR|nr:camk family protein kinase [Vairimorpha apis BRL 01]
MHTYHIQETLASGSTSKVKRLRTTDNKELAIKIMKKTTTPLKSFNKELTIHKSLQHKNIIKYIDSCQDTENYYLIMDLAEYELHDFIENNTGIDPIVKLLQVAAHQNNKNNEKNHHPTKIIQ